MWMDRRYRFKLEDRWYLFVVLLFLYYSESENFFLVALLYLQFVISSVVVNNVKYNVIKIFY